jgi:hypothetical protein
MRDKGFHGATRKRLQFPRVFDHEDVESLVETLEIMADRRLFDQIMAASETIDDDLRRGKLHSFEEAFEGV